MEPLCWWSLLLSDLSNVTELGSGWTQIRQQTVVLFWFRADYGRSLESGTLVSWLMNSVTHGKKTSVTWEWIRKQVMRVDWCTWFIGYLGKKYLYPDGSHFCSDILERPELWTCKTERDGSVLECMFIPRWPLAVFKPDFTFSCNYWVYFCVLQGGSLDCFMFCMLEESRKENIFQRKWKMLCEINIAIGIWKALGFLSSSKWVAQVSSEGGKQTLGKVHSFSASVTGKEEGEGP